MLVDFVAMFVVAVGTAADAVSLIVIVRFFDLSQTWLTNHLDYPNDSQELKYLKERKFEI